MNIKLSSDVLFIFLGVTPSFVVYTFLKRLKTDIFDILSLKMKKIVNSNCGFSRYLLPSIAILLTSCYSTFTAQSAKTIERGKVAGGFALGAYRVQTDYFDSQKYASNNEYSEAIPMFPVGLLRVGVLEDLNFNLQTNLITNTTLGLKYQLVKNTEGSNFSMGLNAGAIHFFYVPILSTFEIPFYYSYHTKENHSIYACYAPGWIENIYRQAGCLGVSFKISKDRETYMFFEVKNSTVGKSISIGGVKSEGVDMKYLLYGFGFTFGGF